MNDIKEPIETPTDAELREAIQESADSGNVSADRAERFYDRIRKSIQRYVEKKGPIVEKSADFLLLVPDVFILLWRLVNDSRVSGKNKVLLGSSIAYYIFPLDIIPEALLGPIGFLDDLVLAVYVLNRMLADTDPQILREHWSGDSDILAAIQRVLQSADDLVGPDLLEKIKRIVK